MSYAGTYGPDETCEHDRYRKNCWRCNGSVERFARELPMHQRHAEVVERTPPTVREYPVIMYRAHCEGCGTTVTKGDRDKAQEWADKHAAHVLEVAASWAGEDEMMVEARRRGLL